jgi:hypothetical protein
MPINVAINLLKRKENEDKLDGILQIPFSLAF